MGRGADVAAPRPWISCPRRDLNRSSNSWARRSAERPEAEPDQCAEAEQAGHRDDEAEHGHEPEQAEDHHTDDGGQEWGPTDLGKTIFADPYLLEGGGSASPSPAALGSESQLVILAQGGDVCRLDPTDGSPAGARLCEEVPL